MARLLGFAALLVASHAALAAAARPAAHRPRAATAAAAVAAAPAANWTLVPVQQAVLDLDLPAEQRWNEICAAFKSSGAWTRERRRASSAYAAGRSAVALPSAHRVIQSDCPPLKAHLNAVSVGVARRVPPSGVESWFASVKTSKHVKEGQKHIKCLQTSRSYPYSGALERLLRTA